MKKPINNIIQKVKVTNIHKTIYFLSFTQKKGTQIVHRGAPWTISEKRCQVFYYFIKYE